MSPFIKKAIEIAKKVAAAAVPGSGVLIEVAEDAIDLLKSVKDDPAFDLDEQTQAEIDAEIDALQEAVNKKADDTVDRLRGES